MIKRILYLGYYFRITDKRKLNDFLRFAEKSGGRNRFVLFLDMLLSVVRFKISLLEYFQFGFYKLNNAKARRMWAGTGFMYEYQKIMNPLSKREVLNDKRKFHKAYISFFKHHVLDLAAMKVQPKLVDEMLKAPKIVLKESDGKCGLGTVFIDTNQHTQESLIRLMEKEGLDLAESYIVQHPDLNRLSPSGVNTVRIFTQLNANDEVEILGCRQRISVDSPVDNLAAGNLAAVIDEKTGIISGPGVYSDITKKDQTKHPITKVPIKGFQVPFWEECLDLVKRAALAHPENRSIGWDVIVTEDGPGLLEGNHDWCKLVWQLPVKKGLKPVLQKHLNALHQKKNLSKKL